MPSSSRFTLRASLLAAACVPVAPAPATGDRSASEQTPAEAIAVFERLLNAARDDAGCPADLIRDERLAAIAHAHSADMDRRGYFSHDDPEGRGMADRLRAAGIQLRAAAENIAFGPATGEQVFTGWRNSPGHNRNMMNCEYTHHGVGMVDGYWTHVFLRPPGD